VFGVPDERLGEEVGSVIVLKPGQDVDVDALRADLQARIAKHKVPRYIWTQRETLPRNANGKFLKREVKETLDLAAAR
jgi:long-chain acyl-CoA synthetase